LHHNLQIISTNLVQTLSNITCQRGAKSNQDVLASYWHCAGRMILSVPLQHDVGPSPASLRSAGSG